MAQQYGNASVVVTQQNPSGIAGADPALIEQTECFITLSCFDTTDAPMTPQSVQYRIDDVASDTNILPWTAVQTPPSTAMQITVTSAQNAMVNLTRMSETHQVLFAITDPSGNGPFYARALFDLIRVPGLG